MPIPYTVTVDDRTYESLSLVVKRNESGQVIGFSVAATVADLANGVPVRYLSRTLDETDFTAQERNAMLSFFGRVRDKFRAAT